MADNFGKKWMWIPAVVIDQSIYHGLDLTQSKTTLGTMNQPADKAIA